MRIQHNIMAMNAYRNYTTNTSALSKNLEKLSSGYKINRAGDDAAGLAISEKMRAQITGLETAQKNAKDGISLVQTAEGALTEVHDMLNRMVELADQSANGTYDNDVDRANLQKEVNELRAEIDRIADSANFNGINLLDGNLAGGSTTQLGSAFNSEAIATTDGTTASAAKQAQYTFSTNSLTDANALGGTSVFKDLTSAATQQSVEDCVLTFSDGTTAKVSDIFTVGGDSTGWTLEALTAGSLDSKITGEGFAGIEMTQEGLDAGKGSSATKAKYELEFDLTKISGNIDISIGDKKFTLVTDGVTTGFGSDVTVIDITGNMTTAGSTGTGRLGAMEAIYDAMSAAFSGQFDLGDKPTDGTSTTFKLTMTAKKAGTDGNLGEIRVANDANSAITETYTEGKEAAKATEDTFAQVTYELNLKQFSVGDTLEINGKKVEIVDDADVDNLQGKISLKDFQDEDKLAEIFEQMNVGVGKLSFKDGKVTITGTTAGQKAEDFGTSLGIKATCQNDGKPITSGGSLVLQIGDTSDDFNQLEVTIDDMHAKALGIDTLSIATQDDAAAAVDMIKEAINKVSGVRGTLGATQNRLDHTINNLSVMTENIQDAESTIRDTDVADEMMAYTKNNILIQSAQAMLAQANQVPQGVLQLLQ